MAEGHKWTETTLRTKGTDSIGQVVWLVGHLKESKQVIKRKKKKTATLENNENPTEHLYS